MTLARALGLTIGALLVTLAAALVVGILALAIKFVWSSLFQ